MKIFLSTILLFLTLGFTYSQVTETFDGVTISGGSFTTNSGLSFTTTDTFESYGSDLQDGGVTLTAPFPHVYLDQSGSYFEFRPSSTDKLLSSLSFNLWYSNSNSGTTLACECKSYDSSGNLLETITKDVIAKTYNFSGTQKKIRCNITEINFDNAVFIDNITFTLVDQNSTSENDPFAFNSINPLGIESTFSNNSTGNYSFSVGIGNTASGEHSSAFGQEANATGLSSLASGYDTTASGAYSSAFGQSTTASGSHSSAFGNLSTATAFTSFSAGSSSHANGAASIALGSGANAQNDYAVAIGHGATTSAESSVALGYNVTASEVAATAMGYNTTASGGSSVAMGHYTKSSDYNSLVIGRYNLLGSTVTNSATDFSAENTAFVIGNGTNSDNRSDALTVLFDGTTTIAGNVTAPAFIGDGSQLTNLSVSSPFSFNDTSGNGIQSNTNTASGANSTAMGYATTASDYASVVIGQYNSSGSSATSANSFSTSAPAFVIGNGADTNNKSDALTVLFDGTTTIAGDLNVNSDKKVFFGNQSFIEGAFEGTVLILNTNNNILFRPGGTTTVNFEPNGDAIFNGDVKVTSDKRLKANIVSLGATLSKLLQIDGKSYIMKKDESEKQKIGLLAQDIEKVFPELVSESNGIKSVNYQGLVPVLINALKEQQSEIDELKSMVLELVNNN